MTFKDYDGTEIPNVSDYVKNYFAKNPGDYELFIGCDSLPPRANVTTFVVVVLIYKIGKGAHIIYRKVKDKSKLPMISRLWKEVELSVELATTLKDNGVLDYEFKDKQGQLKSINLDIHLDINPDENQKSHQIYDSATGFVKGMGFHCSSKPEAWAASYAADAVCRGKFENHLLAKN